MLPTSPSDIAPSEITPQETYLRRREFLKNTAAFAIVAGLPAMLYLTNASAALATEKFGGVLKSPFSTEETHPPYKDVPGYNNFY